MFNFKPEPNTHLLLIDAVDNARKVAMRFRYEMKTGTGVAYCFVADREYAKGVANAAFEVLDTLETDLLNIPIGTTDETIFEKKNDTETQADV